jgi:hypothetical protein
MPTRPTPPARSSCSRFLAAADINGRAAIDLGEEGIR